MCKSRPQKLVWRSNRNSPIAGVILAAGRSSRFTEGPKLDARVHGRSLLRRACDAANESSLDAVVAVLGSDADLLQGHCHATGMPVIINPAFAEGQSTSMRLGLDALPKDAVAALFLAADQPFLGAIEIDQILKAARSTDKVVRAVAPARDQGQLMMGTPVVFPRRRFSALRKVKGDAGGRQLLRTLAETEILDVVLAEQALWDVDSMEDLERLERYVTR